MLDWMAILGGLMVGFGVSLLVAVLVGALEVISYRRETGIDVLTADEAENERFFARLREDATFQVGALVISLLTDVLAGYLTAQWADTAPLVHAGIVGALSIALTWLIDWREVTPAWSMYLWTALAIPAALAGAAAQMGMWAPFS